MLRNSRAAREPLASLSRGMRQVIGAAR
jgi:hypothetical protein